MTSEPAGPRRRLLTTARSAVLALGLLAAVTGPAPTAAARGPVCVGVVVAATTAGSDDRCVELAEGSSGLDALVVRARAAGLPAPRFSPDGQVCAIDGFPATGCGVDDGAGGYRYWSYWHKAPGASAWTYARVGAGARTMRDGGMEGWAFSDGGPEQSTRPPARSHAQVCPPPAPAPSSAAPAPAPAPPPSNAAPRPPAPPPPAPGRTAAPAAPAPAPAAVPGSAAASTTTTGPRTGSAPPAPTTTEGAAATAPTASPSASTSAASPSESAPAGVRDATSTVVTATDRRDDPGPGVTALLPALLLVGALGGAAVVVARSRRRG